MMNVKQVVLDRSYELLVRATAAHYRRIREGYTTFHRTRSALEAREMLPVFRHYYEPYVDERDLWRPLDRDRDIPGLDLNEQGQLELLPKLTYHHELEHLEGGFGGLDGKIYYSFVRHLKPKRILEVGSGASAVTAKAALLRNEAEDPNNRGELTVIEPFENPWLESVADHVVRTRVEQCDDGLFDALEENDILFIDSTHMIRPQGDVLHEYLYVLGRLKPGVVIHVHDIFTPKDYPRQWVIERRHMWNEQYLLEGFLSFNPSFQVMVALNFLYHHHFEALRPCGAERDDSPGSFWFRRVR